MCPAKLQIKEAILFLFLGKQKTNRKRQWRQISKLHVSPKFEKKKVFFSFLSNTKFCCIIRANFMQLHVAIKAFATKYTSSL